ncbi:RIB43A family protein [Giardia duodenalis]|uniref:RIB43A family protein n=1 Tax=Giardia intestinalis TaxID=5741 RepID=V6TJ16_GIAIN|nr:RIB43A family protein [Giardia intestinalis]
MAELFERTAHYRDDKNYDRTIEGRRIFDEERRKRIFNPSLRTMGVDVDALDLQTAERRAREAAELMEQIDAEERLLAANRFLTQREREFHRMRLLCDRQIAEFNFENIRPEYSREYDIHRKDVLKVDNPIRQDTVVLEPSAMLLNTDGTAKMVTRTIPDSKLGVSSGQVFDGEDLERAEREQLMRDEMRAALEQQIYQARAKREAEKLQDLEDQLRELKICDYLSQVERDFHATRRQERINLKHDQMRQAELDAYKRAEEKRRDDCETLQHHANFGSSKLMMEIPSAGVPMEYKGWSDEDREEHMRQLAQQCLDDKKKRRAELEEKILWEAKQLNVNRDLTLRDNELKKEKRRIAYEQRAQLEYLSEEEKAREIARIQELGRNEITDDFFKHFQKTSR